MNIQVLDAGRDASGGYKVDVSRGHLMVSRSETARALLTPGEILQLPQTDEVVLMSGAPPIKATKARYYADRRLQARVVKAPASCGQRHGAAPPDDWSTLPPLAPDSDLAKEHRRKLDSANGGLRREPELPEHVEVVAKPRIPFSEFEFSDSGKADVDQAAANNERLRRTMVRSARQASLDLGDGIDM